MDISFLLKKYYGFSTFRPNQCEIINDIMAGNDCLVLMPTGGGKSICYQIPALAMLGTAIVVSPLISLMYDQVEALKANGISAEALNSGNDMNQDLIIKRRCLAGDIKLLYMSPERLISEIPFLLSEIKISLIAIDEAHCISQWGRLPTGIFSVGHSARQISPNAHRGPYGNGRQGNKTGHYQTASPASKHRGTYLYFLVRPP